MVDCEQASSRERMNVIHVQATDEGAQEGKYVRIDVRQGLKVVTRVEVDLNGWVLFVGWENGGRWTGR